MAFTWAQGWDDENNNNGATAEDITKILATAEKLGEGDAGLRKALTNADDSVTIDKGIHPQGPHITVGYLGGTWHVDLVGTANGGVAGYRVGKVSQHRQM